MSSVSENSCKNSENYFSVDSNIDDFSMSSDSEVSKLLILPKEKSCVHTTHQLNSSDSDENCSMIHYKTPLATSSPLRQINVEKKWNPKQIINSEQVYSKDSGKSVFSHLELTSNLNKCNNILTTSPLNNVTNILNTKNIRGKFHAVDQIELFNTLNLTNKKINKGALCLNTIISNNSQKSYNTNNTNTINQTEYNENDLIKTDLSELFQMELSIKMFSGNMVPYLNGLKHEILQLMNNCIYKPDKHIIKVSKNVNDIIKNIHKIMKLNMKTCNDNKLNKKKCTTISFSDVDLNSLYLLNDKLDYVDTILEPVKLLLNDNALKYLKRDITVNKLDTRISNNCLVGKNLTYFGDSNSFEPDEPIINNDNEINLSTEIKTFDSFDHIRKLNKSITLSPLTQNSILFQKSFEGLPLNHHNLNYDLVEYPNIEVSEMLTPDINSSNKEINIDTQLPANKTNSINSQIENYDENPVRYQNKYWLRDKPKPTEHYNIPFKSKSISSKRKSSKYNDMFISEGSGKKKVILQYKFHSVLKSNEIMKKMCPESIKCKLNNNNQNISLFNISNIKSKTNDKPCRCGIFPSQVPSFWNDLLHESLHQNLHKLQFKMLTAIDVVSKINDNGFLYDIIQINENYYNDKNLKLALNNIQDYISLELDISKNNISNLNHSIFLAIIPNSNIIGYLEIEPLENACIYKNNQLSEDLISVKFGVSKLWVMVKYRKCGVATKLLKHFSNKENLKSNDIAFAYHRNYGIQFIKKYFAKNSVLIY